jgi:hypothetical protein
MDGKTTTFIRLTEIKGDPRTEGHGIVPAGHWPKQQEQRDRWSRAPAEKSTRRFSVQYPDSGSTVCSFGPMC